MKAGSECEILLLIQEPIYISCIYILIEVTLSNCGNQGLLYIASILTLNNDIDRFTAGKVSD